MKNLEQAIYGFGIKNGFIFTTAISFIILAGLFASVTLFSSNLNAAQYAGGAMPSINMADNSLALNVLMDSNQDAVAFALNAIVVGE